MFGRRAGLKQPATVLPPSVVLKRSSSGGGGSGALRWRGAGERTMTRRGVIGPNSPSLRARSTLFQKNARSRYSRRIVPISRSTNGCETGAYGTDLISSISRTRSLASQRWKRNSGSLSVLTCLGRLWPEQAHLNIRHAETPSMLPGSTPKPTIRRLKTSMTSITQWLRSKIDSQPKKSMLQRLSLAWAINASQEEPGRQSRQVGSVWRGPVPHPCRSRRRRHERSAGRSACSRNANCAASCRRWPR